VRAQRALRRSNVSVVMSEKAENKDLPGRGSRAASEAAQDGHHAERGGATPDAERRFGRLGDPHAASKQFGEKEIAEVDRCTTVDGRQDRRTRGAALGGTPGDVLGEITCEGAPIQV
jgi:creatinine amidohydrolase/Fe(II)-dependent formamide hydrolase-like protein